MVTYEPTVFVVDDDPAILKGLRLLIKSVNLNVEIFSSAKEFLEEIDYERSGCLVLDVRMPVMGGLELQEVLREKKNDLPVIIITGHGDIPMVADAMKKGAFDFIEKPFSEHDLLSRVNDALEKDKQIRQKSLSQRPIMERMAKLTKREKEVLDLVVAGKANKTIAFEFGCGTKNIEYHRANVMKKMEVGSLAELVKVCTEVAYTN